MENAGNDGGAAPKLCPSAQPGMDNCRVLGVVQHDMPQPMLLYLKDPVAATPDVLAMAAPLKPTEVFRLSATPSCENHRQSLRMMQGGSASTGAACLRCPQVTTVTYDLSPETQAVSGLPIVTEQ